MPELDTAHSLNEATAELSHQLEVKDAQQRPATADEMAILEAPQDAESANDHGGTEEPHTRLHLVTPMEAKQAEIADVQAKLAVLIRKLLQIDRATITVNHSGADADPEKRYKGADARWAISLEERGALHSKRGIEEVEATFAGEDGIVTTIYFTLPKGDGVMDGKELIRSTHQTERFTAEERVARTVRGRIRRLEIEVSGLGIQSTAGSEKSFQHISLAPTPTWENPNNPRQSHLQVTNVKPRIQRPRQR
ncbi:MAG: hypothetical protein Q8P27_00545 [Candidatus Peregrinibacteria bacterium]|nr:hypothetical protein [Candidatus Peregrinibacteria bacterium]